MICIIIRNYLSCRPHPACYQPEAGLAVPPTEAIHLKTCVLKWRHTLLTAMAPAPINPQKREVLWKFLSGPPFPPVWELCPNFIFFYYYLASLQWWDKFWPGNKYLREQTVQKCENALIVSLFLFPKKKKKLVRCFVSQYKDSIKDQFYSWCLSLYMHGVVKASIALDLCSLIVPDFLKI